MSTEKTSSHRSRGSICCLFGVVAVVVIILWYVRVIPVPSGSCDGQNGRDDSELTAKRVDRLSFFNVSDLPGATSVELELYQDDGWTVAWALWPTAKLTLTAEDGESDGRIVDQDIEGKEPLVSIKCTVTLPGAGVTRSCYIKAQPGFWIAGATFWYAKDRAGNLRLCGQILQSNGSLETHEREELD